MRRFPEAGRRLVARSAKAQLPTGFDHQRHLSPPYDPWDQRLCIAPDSDLFRALNADNVEIVTDRIERFTENGLLLKSGEEIEADVVVTATGLKVLGLGGARLSIDGEPSPFGSHFAYKAMMLDDVPNFAFLLGYTNASWTLKVDLVCEYLVRLLQYMAAEGHTVVVARPGGPLERRPLSDLTSGYVMRSGGAMPWAGDQDPWQLKQNWYFDRRMIRRSPIADGTLEFS
jgi:monooxygenase